LLDPGVETKSILIEPNSGDMRIAVADPAYDLVNMSYFTGLFGRTFMQTVYPARPLSRFVWALGYTLVGTLAVMLMAFNILLARSNGPLTPAPVSADRRA
jgi:hypothetical protein